MRPSKRLDYVYLTNAAAMNSKMRIPTTDAINLLRFLSSPVPMLLPSSSGPEGRDPRSDSSVPVLRLRRGKEWPNGISDRLCPLGFPFLYLSAAG